MFFFLIFYKVTTRAVVVISILETIANKIEVVVKKGTGHVNVHSDLHGRWCEPRFVMALVKEYTIYDICKEWSMTIFMACG